MKKSAVLGLAVLAIVVSEFAAAQSMPAKPVLPDVSCQPPDGEGNARRCPVSVTVNLTPLPPATPTTCTVNAPNVILSQQKKVVIVWDLPAGFAFCPALGDGVFLTQPDDVSDEQFEDFGVPDDGVGNPTFTKCRNKFRILAVNSKNAAKPYGYRLQFRQRAGAKLVCTADPFIKNG